MKRTSFLMLILSSAFAGCIQTSDHPIKRTVSGTDPIPVASIDTICFERYSGSRNQDTASVRIIISGTRVNGDYSNFPYQKDARIGKISGTRSGDIIKGIWRYKQEGMIDSIPIEFKLQGDTMLQKKTTFNMESGREILPDTSNFTVLFKKIDCKRTDYRMHKD
jgi:hypothetical protein